MMPALALVLAVSHAPAPLTISDVVADRLVFSPTRGDSVSWRFRAPGTISLKGTIYDARDLLVKDLEPRPLSGDDRVVTWDGTDDQGRPAPPGYYLLVLRAGTDGREVVYDPSDTTGGALIQASDVRFDPGTSRIRYALAKPALLRILLGLKGDGPLLRTLVDWVARGAGEHAEPWDGMDASSVVRFSDSPQLDVQVWAYELPVNAVVLEGRSPSPAAPAAHGSAAEGAGRARPEFLSFGSNRPRRPRTSSRPHEMYNHWQHERSVCHDPEALVTAPEAKRDDEGRSLLDRPLPLRLELPAGEAAMLHEERFEAVIYVDGSFVFEEEQGYLPFTWMLQPEMVTPGEHVITFMIRGYEGHFGTTSIRVMRPSVAGPAAAR